MQNKTNHRRDFLKKTAAAGASITLPCVYSPTNTLGAVTREKNDRIPIGLIGAGGMGNGNMRAAKAWVDVVAIADVDQKIDAIQLAYSMGGMSIKAYQMEVENPAFDEDADDSKVTEIALGLAF